MKLRYYFFLVGAIGIYLMATDKPKVRVGLKRKFFEQELQRQIPSVLDLIFSTIHSHNNASFNELIRRFAIDINVQNDEGETFLMAAVRAGNLELVNQLLARRDIDPDLADNDGITPLMAAIILDDNEIAELLIHGMATLGIIDEEANTALLHAVERNNDFIVSMLIDLGGDTVLENQINDQGMTALMLAVQKGNTNIVSKILDLSDIEINKTNSKGQSALSVARSSTHANKDAITKLLIARGARE